MTYQQHNRARRGDYLIRYFCSLLAMLCLAQVAYAQVNVTTDSGSSSLALVDEASVIDNLTSAFTATAEQRVDEAQISADALATAKEFSRATTDAFTAQARLEINELKGDGVLEATEVTAEIDRLRSQYMGRLEQGLAAIAAGHSPPPQRGSFQSPAAWLAALAKYTVLERNAGPDWLRFAASIAAGLLVAWLLSKGLHAAGNAVRRSDRPHTARMIRALAAPAYLAALVIALRVAFEWVWIPGVADDFVDRIVQTALFGALFWFVWNVCSIVAEGLAWILRKTYDKDIDAHVVLVASRVLRIIALGVFALVIVNHILDSNLTGLVAGLGIIGVALSFILRSTIENIAASFTIFGDKPFQVGDLIIHDGTWGRVETIGFRSTRFRTLKGHLVTIPNARLIDRDIHNSGARPSIRRRFRIGLPYDTTADKVEQAMSIVRDLLKDHRGQPEDQPPHVALEAFGDFAIKLLVQYNFEPADYWEALGFDTEFNLALMQRFEEAGIAFALPAQTLFLNDATEDGLALVDAAERARSSDEVNRSPKTAQKNNDHTSPNEAAVSVETA